MWLNETFSTISPNLSSHFLSLGINCQGFIPDCCGGFDNSNDNCRLDATQRQIPTPLPSSAAAAANQEITLVRRIIVPRNLDINTDSAPQSTCAVAAAAFLYFVRARIACKQDVCASVGIQSVTYGYGEVVQLAISEIALLSKKPKTDLHGRRYNFKVSR